MTERVECLDTMPSESVRSVKIVLKPQYAYPIVGRQCAICGHINTGDNKGGEEEQGHEWRSDQEDSEGHPRPTALWVVERSGRGRARRTAVKSIILKGKLMPLVSCM